MEIFVELFLRFRKFSPTGSHDGPMRINVPGATTVVDLLDLLAIPDRAEKVVLVDGNVCSPGTELIEGQTVSVFPPLEGG
jgi:sulfur carrier protein ThiS